MKTIAMNWVHAGWEYEFAKTGFEIHRYSPTGWGDNLKRPKPDNVVDFYGSLANTEADIIIANRVEEMASLYRIDKPKIFVVHTERNCTSKEFQKYKDYFHVVHICNYTRQLVGCGEVIYHGVTPSNYPVYNCSRTKRSIVGSACNIIGRAEILGLDNWIHATAGKDSFMLGDKNLALNKGIEIYPAIDIYGLLLIKNRVFFNPTNKSIMPMALLDAMACGMPIVAMKNCGIPEVIIHGHNGYLADTQGQARHYINMLLGNEEECTRLGSNARSSVINYFNSDRMARDWHELIRRVESGGI